MIRQFIFLMLIATSAFSQTKKANPKSNNVAKDTSALVALKSDTMSDLEKEIRAERKFGVYTRKAKRTDNKMRLCVQLTSPKSVFELPKDNVGRVEFEGACHYIMQKVLANV